MARYVLSVEVSGGSLPTEDLLRGGGGRHDSSVWGGSTGWLGPRPRLGHRVATDEFDAEKPAPAGSLVGDEASKAELLPVTMPGSRTTEDVELRRLRGDRTLGEVAEATLISTSKLSRLENGHGVPQARDLRDLVTYYDLSAAVEALRRPFGSSDDVRAQLDHLHTMSRQSNVSLRLVPFAAGPHAGLQGMFTILQYAEDIDRDIVAVESHTGERLLEQPSSVLEYLRIFDAVSRKALDHNDSRALIGEIRDRTHSLKGMP